MLDLALNAMVTLDGEANVAQLYRKPESWNPCLAPNLSMTAGCTARGRDMWSNSTRWYTKGCQGVVRGALWFTQIHPRLI